MHIVTMPWTAKQRNYCLIPGKDKGSFSSPKHAQWIWGPSSHLLNGNWGPL